MLHTCWTHLTFLPPDVSLGDRLRKRRGFHCNNFIPCNHRRQCAVQPYKVFTNRELSIALHFRFEEGKRKTFYDAVQHFFSTRVSPDLISGLIRTVSGRGVEVSDLIDAGPGLTAPENQQHKSSQYTPARSLTLTLLGSSRESYGRLQWYLRAALDGDTLTRWYTCRENQTQGHLIMCVCAVRDC